MSEVSGMGSILASRGSLTKSRNASDGDFGSCFVVSEIILGAGKLYWRTIESVCAKANTVAKANIRVIKYFFISHNIFIYKNGGICVFRIIRLGSSCWEK